MDMARVELLKNEKIFSIPRKMAAERDSARSCPLSYDTHQPDGISGSNYNSKPYRRDCFLPDRSDDI